MGTPDFSSDTQDTSAPLTDATALDPADASLTPDDNTPPPSSGEGDATDPAIPAEPASMAEAISQAMDAAPDGEAPEADKATEADDPDADSDQDAAQEGDEQAPTEEETGTGETDGTDEDDDLSPEELEGVGKRAQKRIAKLLSQRKEARADADTLRPDAERFQSIRQFMTENQLADGEVADLFKAGADLKSGDPQRMQAFLDTVQPLVHMALEATGQAVPADLQEQVETGELTETAAHQMGRTRFEAQSARTQAAQATAREQANAATQNQNGILAAVQGWQEQMRQTDPDFDLKADALNRVSQALVAQKGLPQSPEQAVEFAKQAHEEATRMLTAMRPKPKPTRPTPNAAASSKRNGVQPKAESLEDAISAALGG